MERPIIYLTQNSDGKIVSKYYYKDGRSGFGTAFSDNTVYNSEIIDSQAIAIVKTDHLISQELINEPEVKFVELLLHVDGKKMLVLDWDNPKPTHETIKSAEDFFSRIKIEKTC